MVPDAAGACPGDTVDPVVVVVVGVPIVVEWWGAGVGTAKQQYPSAIATSEEQMVLLVTYRATCWT